MTETYDDRELWLSNVITQTMDTLGVSQPNDLLEKFYRELLKPAADRLGINLSLTSRDRDLSYWLTGKALDKFHRFSAGASKHAGYLLPRDRERWLDFVLRVRAVERVLRRVPPAVKRRVPDSVIIEEYLAVCSGLKAAVFARPRVFCNSSTSDYCEIGGDLHSNLVIEFSDCSLVFIANLPRALRELRS